MAHRRSAAPVRCRIRRPNLSGLQLSVPGGRKRPCNETARSIGYSRAHPHASAPRVEWSSADTRKTPPQHGAFVAGAPGAGTARAGAPASPPPPARAGRGRRTPRARRPRHPGAPARPAAPPPAAPRGSCTGMRFGCCCRRERARCQTPWRGCASACACQEPSGSPALLMSVLPTSGCHAAGPRPSAARQTE